jgi:hypothetical protein
MPQYHALNEKGLHTLDNRSLHWHMCTSESAALGIGPLKASHAALLHDSSSLDPGSVQQHACLFLPPRELLPSPAGQSLLQRSATLAHTHS